MFKELRGLSDLLEMELQAVVSYLMWVLEIKLRSSALQEQGALLLDEELFQV